MAVQAQLLELLLQLMAVDVVFKVILPHVITEDGAEGANPVALLVLLQFTLGDSWETLLAEATHQTLLFH